jgi:signal transduction histidine kinase
MVTTLRTPADTLAEARHHQWNGIHVKTFMDEELRVAAVHSYRLLDAPRPTALDDLTRLAVSIFDTPISAVTLVDRDRQWFAGSTGLADAQTSRDLSFCAHTIPDKRMLVVPDTTRHPQFAAYANVVGAPHIRFYAGAPLVDQDGHALGALCIADDRPRDISPRQRESLAALAAQAVSQLELIRNRLRVAELADELARASQREEDLAAAISHELRTPVAAIQGYLEVLTEDAELAQYQWLIDPIQRNGQRLIQMVDHLLAGTRPADAAFGVHVAPVDLAGVANAALTACAPLIERRSIRVRFITGEAPVIASADYTRLSQAVEHLVRNAALFTPAEGAVTVRITATPQPIIEVNDEGVGIPADELPFVFERFFRGRYARAQAVPGVGLGLSIARRIVEAHCGTLGLTSNGAGTAARITLPSS